MLRSFRPTTLKAVSTALDIPLKAGSVSAEGDLDFRGTLGVAKDAPVGFAQIRLTFDVETDAPQEKLDQLLKDEGGHIRGTLSQLDKTTAHTATMAEDAAVIARRLRRAEGTVGALLYDEEIYDDLKEFIRDLKKHPWKLIWRD